MCRMAICGTHLERGLGVMFEEDLVASLIMRFVKFSSVCCSASTMLLLIGWG